MFYRLSQHISVSELVYVAYHWCSSNSGTTWCTTVPLSVMEIYCCQQPSSAAPLCCVPSAVHWVRLWVWHRVSPSGSAVLWHQCQAHPGSANTVEGELARGLVWVGDCGFGDILASADVCPLLIYHMGTNKAQGLKEGVLAEEEAPIYWMWHPGLAWRNWFKCKCSVLVSDHLTFCFKQLIHPNNKNTYFSS